MYQRFLDAMAIVREAGAPSLFITMTYNPNWPEIKGNLQKASGFHAKRKELNKDLDEGGLRIQAARVHVVEYQKRGLPHAHILLVLRTEDKPASAEDVDNLVWAELPDKDKYPDCGIKHDAWSLRRAKSTSPMHEERSVLENVPETFFGRDHNIGG
ncbi:Helitron helicase [Phytophthora megakarya]|uniref:Helitron helicase n=1 Tax=Phytophthora megakarya TaxID=4795 RepID=A0A225VZA0_9STRA|nr:Helitron helicase [Phytophthora megakarya]